MHNKGGHGNIRVEFLYAFYDTRHFTLEYAIPGKNVTKTTGQLNA